MCENMRSALNGDWLRRTERCTSRASKSNRGRRRLKSELKVQDD